MNYYGGKMNLHIPKKRIVKNRDITTTKDIERKNSLNISPQ